MTWGWAGRGAVGTPALGAAAAVHYHILDNVKFDLVVVVVVEHLHRRQLTRAATRSVLSVGAVQLLDEGSVGVLVSVQEGTLAVAKVCFVYLWRHDEVPP